MKLCSYVRAGQAGFGIVTDAGIVDLGKRLGLADLKALIASGVEKARPFIAEAADFGLDEISFAPVLPNPGKIMCVGLNYHEHVLETGNVETPNPTMFTRYPESQVGHGEALIKPRESDKFDYEGELAVIIGRGGRRIAEADALAHVAGYACYNDGSVRDWQRHTQQYLPGKNFVGTGGFGPWMVTADEIPDPAVLHLQTRLNGEVMQEADVSQMITPISKVIAYCSTFMPLVAGDVIVSGTPGGVGSRRNPPVWLRDGDVVEVEISGVGTLRNPVVAET
jgi:2-keto-4-pentenoate hydratase/2-oxohepta-3-ene-1,7-dioic acid hydratase in catechol pathway